MCQARPEGFAWYFLIRLMLKPKGIADDARGIEALAGERSIFACLGSRLPMEALPSGAHLALRLHPQEPLHTILHRRPISVSGSRRCRRVGGEPLPWLDTLVFCMPLLCTLERPAPSLLVMVARQVGSNEGDFAPVEFAATVERSFSPKQNYRTRLKGRPASDVFRFYARLPLTNVDASI
ncbi:hypothetical protein SAMN05216459_11547 [Ensifer sp. OV372]|nr:hypothetical protein DEU52_12021 [Ensifer adhaerens]SFH06558.1 hypothetical protein SAMN05216459_11547 [Ensifer sp. OV372]